MLEAAVPVIPSLWASVHGWLTPTVLFLLLNLVIGTIAVTSSRGGGGGGGHNDTDGVAHKLCRSPSLVLDRIRSFNLSPYRFTQTPATEPEPEPATEEPEPEENHHITRSQSDTKPAAGETPGKLAKKMTKSATMKSAFNHFEFEAEDDGEAEAEKRRPATTREASMREEDAEVDARADDFINRFKQQLKLQRLDSFIRYKEMLKRGN